MSRNPEQWLGLALIGIVAAGLFRPPAFGLGDLSLPAWALPPLIFLLQSANMAFDTFRTLAVARGRRATAWAAGFSQAFLFVVAIAGVLQNLSDPWNLVAYAAGFATGNVVGILAESGFAPGHSLLRVVSPHRGSAIADALRRQGWGATEIPGRGQDGTVTLIFCHVPRREAARVSERIVSIDPEAFITSENVRQFRGGWRA
jgi:uncharacterized protein YebE (UPF0316 family)